MNDKSLNKWMINHWTNEQHCMKEKQSCEQENSNLPIGGIFKTDWFTLKVWTNYHNEKSLEKLSQ